VSGRSKPNLAVIVHADLPLALRVLRDELSRGVTRVLVDSPREHADMVEFAAAFMPDAATRIELYGGPRPIFDLHGIEQEIAKGTRSEGHAEVGRSPGDRSDEAMTTIDVNTGRVRRSPQSRRDYFRTNLEASVAIARQLRLRNARWHHHHRRFRLVGK